MFAVGDEVVYDGSLGRHNARVAAVHGDGSVDVRIDGLPELVRTDEASLSPRYTEGGFVSGITTVTNTSGVAEEFVPPPSPDSAVLPTPRPGVELESLGEPPAGFVHDDTATLASDDPTQPTGA